MRLPKPSREIAASRRKYADPYAHLNGEGDYDAPPHHAVPEPAPQEIRAPKSRYRDVQIEQKVRELHAKIWRRRHEFWPDGVPADLTKLLDPAVAAACLGYSFEKPEYIGNFTDGDDGSTVAGLLDRDTQRISVANHLPHIYHRYTAAHELGHAVLHTGTGLHRDRAVDGSSMGQGPRDAQEAEADKFAAYFLMPRKLIKERFKQIFGLDGRFTLTDNTAFALDPADPEGLMRRCRTVRDLSRILATAEHYNGRHVVSLAARFGVSPGAMAIRLEELGHVLV